MYYMYKAASEKNTLENGHIIIISILVLSQLAGDPLISPKPLLHIDHKVSIKIVFLR